MHSARRFIIHLTAAAVVLALLSSQASAYQAYFKGYSFGYGMYYDNITGIYAVCRFRQSSNPVPPS